MNTILIKPYLFLLYLIALATNCQAQQNHYIYIQTENKQPFYVKLDKSVLSSTASGYLIIPKLLDGDYTLKIGFPKNEWAEQSINCIVNSKDGGYVLKNFGDKGWGLFNLQTLVLVMGANKPEEKNTIPATYKTDDFSTILSNVVKDPSIAKNEEVKAIPVEEVKQVDSVSLNKVQSQTINEPGKKEDNKDSVVSISNDSLMISKLEIGKDSAEGLKQVIVASDHQQLNQVPPEQISKEKADSLNKVFPDTELQVKKEEINIVKDTIAQVIVSAESKQALIIKSQSQISKLLSTENTEGAEMVYSDVFNGKADTIRIFIPKEKVVQELLTVNIEKEANSKLTVKKEENVENVPKFIDITLPNPNTKTDSLENLSAIVITEKKMETDQIDKKPNENSPKPLIANSDCKNFATNDDFLKLRKKMAAENSDDAMLNAAKKLFKAKCFTTDQVKNLSVLFLTDEGKYKFFDITYPFVSDSYNFSSLEPQLIDAYYKERFKVMIRH